MKARILSFILLTVFASTATAQKFEQNRPPIIDVHMHAYAKDERWTHNLQETKAIMNMYPQVYADLAAIDWLRPRDEFHEYLRELVRGGLGKRLMFGSDQMVWPEGFGMAIEAIESASFLTEEQKRDIFYNNAVRFLQLDEKKLGLK
jgi:predicted TIM-barrel fold metal-dependent hydrolase